MTKDVVIVIAGKIGSGKDTVMSLFAGYMAREARAEKHRKIEVVRFADPIKRAIAGMFQHHEDYLLSDFNKSLDSAFYDYKRSGDLVEATPITYGKLQQIFGDKMREINEDIFARIAISKIRGIKNATVIVPDLRFVNELIAIENEKKHTLKKFILIKLVGQHITKSDDKRDPNHQGETEVDDLPNVNFNYILNCNTYKDDAMKNMIKQILISNKIL